MTGYRFLLALLLLLLPSLIVHAADIEWDDGDPNNSFWDSNQNWDPDQQPQPNDKAIVGGNPEVNTLEIFGELENSGTIDITTGTLQPQGEVDNSGVINIGDGSAILSQMIVAGDVTLGGGGTVTLNNSDNLPGSSATLRGGNTADTPVIHEVDHTIRGEGWMIQHWVNNGTIIPEERTGDSTAIFRLDNGSMLNNSDLHSSATTTLQFTSYTLTLAAGSTFVADTQPIVFQGVDKVIGGSLEAVGGGVFDANGLVTLSGVTVNAPIDNTNTSGPINDARLYVDSGGLTNHSTISLEGQSGRNSQFGFTSSGTLDGTGEIVLAGGNDQTFIGVFPGVAHEFTHGTSHTIRGAGSIASPIVNNGTIRAEPGTDGSTLRVNASLTNNAVMQAGSGAVLRFEAASGTTSQGPAGVISAADAGRVELHSNLVNGGSFDTSGSGEIIVTNNTPRLTDVSNLGTFNIPGGRTVYLQGSSFTNHGTVTINSDNINSVGNLSYTSDLSLGGTGEVVLNTPENQPSRIVAFNGNHILTNGLDHTIRGEGFLAGELVNQGRIAGNSAADPISVYGRLSGTGVLENVNIGLNFFVGTGVHSPGESTAIVPLEGDYTISHPLARLEIELGGTAAGSEYDQLNSTGTVHLGGTLDVSLVDLANDYTPAAGDQFDIITSANSDIEGMFNSVLLPVVGLGHLLTWEPIDYTDPLKIVLEIASASPYDVDLDDDGDVDGHDFLLIQKTDPTLIPAWQAEYRAGVQPSTAVQAVPEPGVQGLLLLGLALARPVDRRRAVVDKRR